MPDIDKWLSPSKNTTKRTHDAKNEKEENNMSEEFKKLKMKELEDEEDDSVWLLRKESKNNSPVQDQARNTSLDFAAFLMKHQESLSNWLAESDMNF